MWVCLIKEKKLPKFEKNFVLKLELMTSKVLSYNQWRQNDVKSVAHCRLLGLCVFCAPLDRYIHRHINWHSTNVLVDISAECQPICRLTYRSSVGYFVNQDVPVDISTDISVEHELICQPTLDRYVRRYVDREWLSNCRPTCQSISYWHSADIPLLLAYWWPKLASQT